MKEQVHVYNNYTFTTLEEVTKFYAENDPFNVETNEVIIVGATPYLNKGETNWFIITCVSKDK